MKTVGLEIKDGHLEMAMSRDGAIYWCTKIQIHDDSLFQLLDNVHREIKKIHFMFEFDVLNVMKPRTRFQRVIYNQILASLKFSVRNIRIVPLEEKHHEFANYTAKKQAIKNPINLSLYEKPY